MKIIRTGISSLVVLAVLAFFSVAASTASNAQAMQMCNWMWQPVCGIGKDGKKRTWANECWANKDGATHVKPGACK